MENNLLIKQFQKHDITIYGTFDKPLFKAKEVGDLLGIKNIRDTVSKFDKDFIIKSNVGSTDVGNSSNTWFLTIDGLYEVLFISRKPIAKEFRKWVRGVLEEIRKTGEYKSNKRVEMDTKNSIFIEQYQNKPILYLGMVEHTEEQQIVKYGYTQDTKSTLKRHQTSYGEDFHYIYATESKEHYNLENQIQNHNDLASRHVKKYNGKDRQELLRLDKNFTVKDLVDLIVKMKINNEDDKQLQLQEIELEKTKEKTKQMELDVKILELEIRKLELQQPSSSAIQHPTPQPVQQPPPQITQPLPKPPVQQTPPAQPASQDQDDKKTIVKKFMNVFTEFSQKRSDYILSEELFNRFELWFQERNPETPTPLSQSMFSRIITSSSEYTVLRIPIGPRVNGNTPRKVGVIHRKFTLN